jgi:hypothetical protein
LMRGPAITLVGLALLLTCCSSERPGPEPGVQPEQIGSTGARCPDDHPIATLDGVAFPPDHPDAPVIVPAPDRCFRSLKQAERAGNTVADPPSGSQLIGGIYLVPTSDDLRKDCEQAARSIEPPVACPTLLPDGGSLILDLWRGSALFEGGYPLPEGHDPDAIAHLWVVSTRPELAAAVEGCSVVLRRTPTTVRGHPATLLACDESSEFHGGHVLLVWKEEGGSYAVSLHGVTAVNRRLVRAIAESVEFVDPR